MNKEKLKKLQAAGWNINTISFRLTPAIKALGFIAFCYIQKGDDLMGFFV